MVSETARNEHCKTGPNGPGPTSRHARPTGGAPELPDHHAPRHDTDANTTTTPSTHTRRPRNRIEQCHRRLRNDLQTSSASDTSKTDEDAPTSTTARATRKQRHRHDDAADATNYESPTMPTASGVKRQVSPSLPCRLLPTVTRKSSRTHHAQNSPTIPASPHTPQRTMQRTPTSSTPSTSERPGTPSMPGRTTPTSPTATNRMPPPPVESTLRWTSRGWATVTGSHLHLPPIPHDTTCAQTSTCQLKPTRTPHVANALASGIRASPQRHC